MYDSYGPGEIEKYEEPRYRDEDEYREKRNHMQNPKQIETVIEGASYHLPTYIIDNHGVQDGAGLTLAFCKGNKEDESALRQEGIFTETLLQTSLQYLQSVNVGELSSRETAIAITKIEEALMWLGRRAEDRAARGVQQTYQK